MTDLVKEFIEETIRYIETGKYHEVFTIWYNNYSYDKKHDYQNLTELFQVFEKADLNVYAKSEAARKDIIYEHMLDYIEDILNNDPSVTDITLPDVIRHLNSDLYIGLIDRKNLFKDICKKLLKQRNDITTGPLRITRKQ